MSTSPSHASPKPPGRSPERGSPGSPNPARSQDHGHGSGHDHDHDISKHVKVYIAVFIALLVGTGITVWLHYVHFESIVVTVAIAMFVASVKGFLVAGYFMHLISEKKMIYGIMASTVFFFIGLMGLTVWSYSATPVGTVYSAPSSTRHATPPEAPH